MCTEIMFWRERKNVLHFVILLYKVSEGGILEVDDLSRSLQIAFVAF